MLQIGRRADLARHSGGQVPTVADLINTQLAVLRHCGHTLYVDSVNGNDNASGRSWKNALATIAVAEAKAVSGDTIVLKGSFNEAVTCDLDGVKFIGYGTGPRQTQWTAPTVAGSHVLSLTGDEWLVENLYIRPVAYTTSGIPAGIKLSGANYGYIRGCRFQGKTGSYKAIYMPAADCDNITVENNEFCYLNTATHGAAIWGVNAGGVSFSGWRILDNTFHSLVTAIKLSCRCALIRGNSVAEYGVNAAGAIAQILALGIDLSGTDATNSGGNIVWGNQLGGTYNATLYKVGASGDQWGGNFNVLTGGVTAANPT